MCNLPNFNACDLATLKQKRKKETIAKTENIEIIALGDLLEIPL